MTRCAAVQRRLPGLVDRGEPGDLAVYRHVRSCRRCQARLTEYRELRRTLRCLDGGAVPESFVVAGRRLAGAVVAGVAGFSGVLALGLALRRRSHSLH